MTKSCNRQVFDRNPEEVAKKSEVAVSLAT
jgi:hypothetical protein